MDFTSDNICAVSPEIMTALATVNQVSTMMPYGEDEGSKQLNDRFSALFDRTCQVFNVTTGTAANALALASLVEPWEAILTHEKSHIVTMECGAPEFFTGGAKMILLGGEGGRIDFNELQKTVQTHAQNSIHKSQIRAISLVQTTDQGDVYSLEELEKIGKLALAHGLYVHMDGARFANAVVALGCSPKELVKYVDVLSFGASKNGTMNSEAVVFFRPNLAQNFARKAKRAGHLLSKQRYLSAQLHAYLDHDLWLKNAQNANGCAAYFAERLAKIPCVKFVEKVRSNIIFVEMPSRYAQNLRQNGCGFYSQLSTRDGYEIVRLVCGFSTAKNEIDRFMSYLEEQILDIVAC